jgi:hypothetical protein
MTAVLRDGSTRCHWSELRHDWHWPLPLCPHRELLHALAALFLLIATIIHLWRLWYRMAHNRKVHNTAAVRHKGEAVETVSPSSLFFALRSPSPFSFCVR